MPLSSAFNVLFNPSASPFICRENARPCVFRKWKQWVKGRDWYDFEWYVRKGMKLNFNYLQERISQFDGIEMSRELFIEK
jgi:hypothetical protein